jgi:hypothetical protein
LCSGEPAAELRADGAHKTLISDTGYERGSGAF